MYIEIEPKEKQIPQLAQVAFKRQRESNVIKKSELRIYHTAKALLMALESRLDEYQVQLERQLEQMIEDKEQALNTAVDEAYQFAIDSWSVQQQQWLNMAEQRLEQLLVEQEEMLILLKEDIKHAIISAIQSRLTKISQSDNLICHLIEVLHAEVDDEMKQFSVEQSRDSNGITLTIENQDSVLSINTGELVEELYQGLASL